MTIPNTADSNTTEKRLRLEIATLAQVRVTLVELANGPTMITAFLALPGSLVTRTLTKVMTDVGSVIGLEVLLYRVRLTNLISLYLVALRSHGLCD